MTRLQGGPTRLTRLLDICGIAVTGKLSVSEIVHCVRSDCDRVSESVAGDVAALLEELANLSLISLTMADGGL